MDSEEKGGFEHEETEVSEGLARGTSVGRYMIVGLVGRGGMGEVYAAYDPELDRKVALKLLRAHQSAGVEPSEGRARLLREAQAIARLSDPNVVVVYDVGTFGERVFLAMEYVDGSSLGYWLHAKTRTWREVVNTFTSAGRGLASAHRAGVVHRDFKPDNVMIDREAKVRVMDFGLARSIEGEASDRHLDQSTSLRATLGDGAQPQATDRLLWSTSTQTPRPAGSESPPQASPRRSKPVGDFANDQDQLMTRNLSPAVSGARMSGSTSALASPLTMSGAMMGTPAYMAPEQFRSGAIDARADQFSFCVALYEGLYGERPFEGRNLSELTTNVLKGKVRPAPVRPRVPGWLRRILLRGLRVDADQRYPSMDALLVALSRDPARSQRRWAAGGAVVMLVALLSVGLVRANRFQKTRCLGAEAKLAGVWELPNGKELSPTKEAIRRAFIASGKKYASDAFNAVTNTLDRYVTAWNNMHRDSCEATNVRGEQSPEVLDLRTRCLQDRFSEVRALTDVFRAANGEVVSNAVSATQAIRPIEQCADIVALRAVVRPPDDPRARRLVADVRTQLAETKALANGGSYRKATDQIGRIVEQAKALNYPPVLGEALLQEANIQSLGVDSSEAEKNYEAAIWAGEASRHDEVVVEAAAQLIWIVGYRQRRYGDAERWGRYAEAVLRRLGPGHDQVAGWRANNLSTMYLTEGRYQDALAAAQEAVALKTKALGAEHYDTTISRNNVAAALAKLGRLDEAVETDRRALESLRLSVGPEHPRFAEVQINLAEFLNTLGKFAEARDSSEQCLRIMESELDPQDPILAFGLNALGESLIGSGDPVAALPPLERALRLRESKDPVPDLLGETRFALARALWAANRTPERAVELAGQARTDYEKNPATKDRIPAIVQWLEAHELPALHVSMR